MRWLVVALLLVPSIAFAQYNVPAPVTGGSSRTVTLATEYADDGSVIAKDEAEDMGQEVGASLDFITSDDVMGDGGFKFTDVVLFRLHTLVAIGTATEVFAGVDLLPKQPSFTNESVWQGALLGARYTFGKHVSIYGRGQGGPGMARDGLWVAGQGAVQLRRHIAEKLLFWESTIGGEYTRLFPDDESKVWQVELLAQTGLAIRERHGYFAGWLNFGFHFPLAHKSPMDTRDPQTRVGVSFGGLVGVTRGLDLFIEVSILDRGDREDPATTLPILEGGFDQTRLVFGFNKRFGSRQR